MKINNDQVDKDYEGSPHVKWDKIVTTYHTVDPITSKKSSFKTSGLVSTKKNLNDAPIRTEKSSRKGSIDKGGEAHVPTPREGLAALFAGLKRK
jgi:hypothetical protein